MTVAPELQRSYLMNDAQRAIVEHTTGPLLVIAGPGSGKTRSIILLAMNLLLCGKAKPAELLLCTYTEKAAFEMQDRLTFIAKDVHYQGDLSQLRVGTIHSICNQLVTENLHHTPLGNNYEQLDNFTQQLLIFEHLSEICEHGILTLFQQRWGSPWQIAKKLQSLFDKIVEELIFDKLKDAYPHVRSYNNTHDTFLSCLTFAYRTYQNILARTNRIDFAHLQKCAYNLLQDPIIAPRVTSGLRYVLVDEYQDTNYIQEQILRLLAQATGNNNLCVVGDEDQSLYRFRGATVRNILEFPQKFPGCKEVHLTINYRSHPGIINVCNRWIGSLDWSDPNGGRPSRTEKTIIQAPNRRQVKYPAVFSITAGDIADEATQCAEMIATLKKHGNIHDYSDVALLLQSVRTATSQPYIDALAQQGIGADCSRARAYFQQTEVQLIIACMARIIGYTERSQTTAVEQDLLPEYLAECRKLLRQQCQQYPVLEQELSAIQQEIRQTEETEETDVPRGRSLADYFYRLIFCQPFMIFQQEQAQLQSLVAFSQLLQTFQKYYRHATVTQAQLAAIEQDLFHTFFCLLYTDGFNQNENAHQVTQSGQVQIMTIHQAKGLEFPVIIVGRLDKPAFRSDNEDQDLQPFYQQAPFEAAQLIPAFDLRRLYYVAFSRAQSLLVLSSSRRPQKHFTELLQQIPSWTQTRQQILRIALSDDAKARLTVKPRYSFTGHIQTYETCPRQFQFLREYNFMPAQPADAFAGLLVHQTLERIHRIVIDGQLHILDEQKVHSIFNRTLNFLKHSNLRPLDPEQQERALQQIMNYFRLNQPELQQIEATEMSIQVEKRNYVLTGKIDLLRRGRYGMEIIDFKTRTRPTEDSDRLTFYKQQLYLYAYALEKRTGQLPHRLLIYWTAEPHKRDALMEIPFDEEDIQQVSTHFDQVVGQIKERNFAISRPPARHICKTCDIRHLCTKQGILR